MNMYDNFDKKRGLIIFTIFFIGLIVTGITGVIYIIRSPSVTYDFNSHISYDDVTYELSNNGDVYETLLGCGTYKVGVHIPEGKYTIELISGSCRMVLDDDKNGIHVDSRVRQIGEAETTGSISDADMVDIRLYDGMILELYHILESNSVEEVKVRFVTDNAQLPLIYMENPNKEEKTITDVTIVGVDIPAGVYDLTCISGRGYVGLSQLDDDRWKELIENGDLIGGISGWKEDMDESLNSLRNYYMSTEICNATFKNVVLAERTVIELDEGMEITLTPSEMIESVNYVDFYITK